jgi:hypothetical protein
MQIKMENFLVPIRRKASVNRPGPLEEVETILATQGRAVICGLGGTGYA